MIHDLHPREILEIMLIENVSYDFPWTPDVFEKSFDHGLHCRVLRSSQYKDILGYSVTSLHDNLGHIHNITVHPNWRRLGIAKKLLNDICSLPLVEVRLEVNPKNTPAMEFYKKYGFQFCKDLPAYYDNGEAAILMINRIGQR